VSDDRQVHVIVQDLTGQRVPDARVVVERAPFPKPDRFSNCDKEGEVKFPINSIGLYEISGTATGYETASVTAMITDVPVSVVVISLRSSEL